MIYGFNAAEVFQIAIEIEENGRRFYEKAAAGLDHPEVKKVLSELGAEEIKHKQKFTALKSELPASSTQPTVWDPAGEIDQYLKMMADLHVFRKSDDVTARLAQAKTAESALTLAIQFEKDSIVFFAEMQALAESESAKTQIGQLVKEEQSHIRKLSLQLRKLTRE
ncbi:MAG: ferritin family protein [Thermodesulfobacteriota bacterium]